LYFSDLWEMKSSFVRSLLSIATIQVFVSIIMGLLFFCKNILLSNPLIMVLFLAICFSLWYLSSNQYSIITHYKFIKTK
jgi:hypothetical protein